MKSANPLHTPPPRASFVRVAVTSLALSTSLIAMVSQAQAQNATPPAVRQSVDGNGVDLVLGQFNMSSTDVTIGGDANGLAYTREWNGNGWRSNFVATLNGNGSTTMVSIGDVSDSFSFANNVYVNDEANGATLVRQISGDYIYTTANGTVAVFGQLGAESDGFGSNTGYIKHITRPNGDRLNYSYKTGQWCPDANWNGSSCSAPLNTSRRVQSVTNRFGYQMKLEYASNALTNFSSLANWNRITKVTGINNATEYCDPAADTCSLANSWPFASYARSGRTETVTDNGGLKQTITYDTAGTKIVGVRRAGAASDDIVVTYANNEVASVTNRGVTYIYHVDNFSTNLRYVTITEPNGLSHGQVVSNPANLLITNSSDAVGRVTSYVYDANFRLTRLVAPEQNEVRYSYDARGNVTEERGVAKPGSGLADIVTTSGFAATCTNSLTCNQPLWTKDAKGNQTDYVYSATHGGVLSVTLPAAASGGVRPQQRYGYTGLQAYIRNSSNAVVATGAPIQMLTLVSACQTLASCTGAADEIKTTINYGPQTTGTANTLLPVSVSTGSGDGQLTATSAITYDIVGNAITVDGPLTNVADITRTRYDARRRQVGIVSPDPDGTGSLVPRAQRFTYNIDNQVTLAELGTVTDQSDTAWSNFTSLQQQVTTYDANAREVKTEFKVGATTYSVAQTSYDTRGRVDCVVQRMDPNQWTGQTNACIPQTTGPDGPDRITKTLYNNADEVISVRTGVGTPLESTEVAYSYRLNGGIATVKDGENNLTSYEYDGHDRLSKTRYPLPTKGANASSTTDFEQPSYDVNGNVTQLRQRDGALIGFSYDNLDRRTFMDLVPGGVNDDVTYTYDLLGRLRTAIGASNHRAEFTYDALGRVTGETDTVGYGKVYEYDVAGRRTRYQYAWGGPSISYTYLVTGEVTSIRETGATSGVGVLGTYAYDNLGRRTSLTRGNGTVTNWGYDPASRLAALSHDLAGTADDVAFTYAFNPASQIKSVARNNDSYAWTGWVSFNRSYTVTGLNQYSQSGGVALGYDAKGNLTSSGSQNYGYSQLNMLAGTSDMYMVYDPLGRRDYLFKAGAGTQWFEYSGSSLVAESNGPAITRRFVHGPGTDEPLVWYEGSGTSTRRWYHADERGSIIGISDANGAALVKTGYDEYGIPSLTLPAAQQDILTKGRFRYTGQQWLPELGMYDYKARFYSASLGRFMQTDPIGFAGGINLYAYVGADPVNKVDPLGLCEAGTKGGNSCVKPNDPRPQVPDFGSKSAGEIVVNGTRFPCLACNNSDSLIDKNPFFGPFGSGPGLIEGGEANATPPTEGEEGEIIVNARRPKPVLKPKQPIRPGKPQPVPGPVAPPPHGPPTSKPTIPCKKCHGRIPSLERTEIDMLDYITNIIRNYNRKIPRVGPR